MDPSEYCLQIIAHLIGGPADGTELALGGGKPPPDYRVPVMHKPVFIPAESDEIATVPYHVAIYTRDGYTKQYVSQKYHVLHVKYLFKGDK